MLSRETISALLIPAAMVHWEHLFLSKLEMGDLNCCSWLFPGFLLCVSWREALSWLLLILVYTDLQCCSVHGDVLSHMVHHYVLLLVYMLHCKIYICYILTKLLRKCPPRVRNRSVHTPLSLLHSLPITFPSFQETLPWLCDIIPLLLSIVLPPICIFLNIMLLGLVYFWNLYTQNSIVCLLLLVGFVGCRQFFSLLHTIPLHD